MTFIPEARIEARAAELWRAHSLGQGFDVERLLDALGLGLVWEAVEDEGDAMVLGQLTPDSTWLSSTSGTSIVSRPMAGGSVASPLAMRSGIGFCTRRR